MVPMYPQYAQPIPQRPMIYPQQPLYYNRLMRHNRPCCEECCCCDRCCDECCGCVSVLHVYAWTSADMSRTPQAAVLLLTPSCNSSNCANTLTGTSSRRLSVVSAHDTRSSSRYPYHYSIPLSISPIWPCTLRSRHTLLHTFAYVYCHLPKCGHLYRWLWVSVFPIYRVTVASER